MTSTVLITGASSGFGRATAELFAAQGWNVIASMRNIANGDELASLSNVIVTRLDVQDTVSVEETINAGMARFGQIDVLINNAGFGLFGVFEGTSNAKIREQFDVNLFGAMEVTRQVLPHMRQRKSGVVINVSSGAGVFGLPMLSIYTSSKFALEGFSESLSYELASQGIVVKIVEPGGVISTGFGARSASEVAQVCAPADYNAFISHTAEVFEGLREQSQSTSEDVARVIFDAANDGTGRLRYLATHDIESMVRARRETEEESYMAMMRERFGPCACNSDGFNR